MRDEIFLTPQELQQRRQRRRQRITLVMLIALLLVLGLFAARPASHAIQAWQARRHAQRAFAFIEKEQWSEARTEAVAAYQLRPTEPQAVRAVARFLTRTRQPDALEFWVVLGKISKLTRDDLRDEAAIALMSNETTRAAEAVRELIARKDAGPSDWLLAAQAAQQNNAPDDARKFAHKVLDDARAEEPTQLQAAILILANAPRDNPDPAATEPAWARIKKISTGKTRTALDALVVLTQQTLSNQKSDTGNQQSSIDLARALEDHPLAKAPHKLLATDLRIHADESQRNALLARAINQWKNGDTASLAALAMWLNGKGEYQKTLDSISLEQALQTRDVFLQYLDALAGLERWNDVKQLLTSEKFPLDPMVQQMYLARCSAQLGEKAVSENSWRRALEAASGEIGKLVPLAEYAEKNGNIDIAEAAYNTAATTAPKLRIAQQGRLRIAQRKHDTHKLHAILAEMLAVWPKDAAVQNDEAYTRLLLMHSQQSQGEKRKEKEENGKRDPIVDVRPPVDKPSEVSAEKPEDKQQLASVESLAEKLIERDPASLPHRTLLALTRLLQGRSHDALRVYENIQVAPNALSSSALAVHAAVLEATGHHDDAETEKGKIKIDNLLPEEAALIDK